MPSAKEKRGIFGNCSPKDAMQLFSSVIFLGMTVYVAFFLELPEGTPRQDLYIIATLTGCYGLWRLWQGISGCRLQ